jgi:molecular chaperone HscB
MPSHFLMQQMQWREELEEAVNSPQLERLLEQVITQKNQRFQLVQQYLDQDKNFTAASQEVRAIMFIQKLIDEVKNTMYALEDQ